MAGQITLEVLYERMKLKFQWRPHHRLQFTTDLSRIATDPVMTISGGINNWELERDVVRVSLMICGTLWVNYKSGYSFCTNDVDSGEYQSISKHQMKPHGVLR
jgi:hypothetical protein